MVNVCQSRKAILGTTNTQEGNPERQPQFQIQSCIDGQAYKAGNKSYAAKTGEEAWDYRSNDLRQQPQSMQSTQSGREQRVSTKRLSDRRVRDHKSESLRLQIKEWGKHRT